MFQTQVSLWTWWPEVSLLQWLNIICFCLCRWSSSWRTVTDGYRVRVIQPQSGPWARLFYFKCYRNNYHCMVSLLWFLHIGQKTGTKFVSLVVCDPMLPVVVVIYLQILSMLSRCVIEKYWMSVLFWCHLFGYRM